MTKRCARGVNELFQCIRLDGVNSYTTDDAYLDKVTSLFARIVAQLGPEFSYYVHKVSKAIAPELEPVRAGSFAGEVDRQWREKMATSGAARQNTDAHSSCTVRRPRAFFRSSIAAHLSASKKKPKSAFGD